MKTNYQIQVGKRGVITFPKELRKQYSITDGDVLNLFELSDGVFVISKKKSEIDNILNEMTKDFQDSGETLETMMQTLREVREEYHSKYENDIR